MGRKIINNMSKQFHAPGPVIGDTVKTPLLEKHLTKKQKHINYT